ncbi:MAG: DUF669 domain-containing protein [Thiopseudomonas sp.]|nr:DUF669 domain-containing protein [Thiopseudomonas sp.]
MNGNLSNLNFDANAVQPQESFEPIPAGWYECMIVESEMKPNKAGTGQYLQLRLDVTEGQYSNRVLFERLNLDNPNSTAVEIAQRTLSAICHATGVLQPRDSSDLHNIPLRVKVSVRPAGDGYDASNNIKGYESLGGVKQQAAPVNAAKTAAQPAAQSGAAKKPWE